MRKMIWLVCLVVLAGLPAFAQDAPSVEIFGGASLFHADGAPSGRSLFGGWQASFTKNLDSSFGFKADLGGQYRSIFGLRASAYEFLFGPQFTFRGKRKTGFVHLLTGAETARYAGASSTAFAFGFGGGVDLELGKQVAFRALQFDYIPNRYRGIWTHDIRMGAGIVLKLGRS